LASWNPDIVREEGLLKISDLQEHADEAMEAFRAGNKPVLVTYQGKVIGVMYPQTASQLVEKMMQDPKIRKSLENAEAALAAGTTKTAREIFGDDELTP
jgi:hypothetical protein